LISGRNALKFFGRRRFAGAQLARALEEKMNHDARLMAGILLMVVLGIGLVRA